MPGESHRSIFNINITLYSVLVYLLIHGYSCCSWRVFLAFRKSDCLAAEVWGTEHEGQDVSGGGAVVGVGFVDDYQVCFGEDVVENSARVLGAVLDEM